MAKKARRTTHRSSTGTKLYAVRDAKGRFKDIQTYKPAHGQDIKRRAKGEKYAARSTEAHRTPPDHMASSGTSCHGRRSGSRSCA